MPNRLPLEPPFQEALRLYRNRILLLLGVMLGLFVILGLPLLIILAVQSGHLDMTLLAGLTAALGAIVGHLAATLRHERREWELQRRLDEVTNILADLRDNEEQGPDTMWVQGQIPHLPDSVRFQPPVGMDLAQSAWREFDPVSEHERRVLDARLAAELAKQMADPAFWNRVDLQKLQALVEGYSIDERQSPRSRSHRPLLDRLRERVQGQSQSTS